MEKQNGIYLFKMPPKKKKVEEESSIEPTKPEPEKQSNDLKWKWSKTESLIHGDCEDFKEAICWAR